MVSLLCVGLLVFMVSLLCVGRWSSDVFVRRLFLWKLSCIIRYPLCKFYVCILYKKNSLHKVKSHSLPLVLPHTKCAFILLFTIYFKNINLLFIFLFRRLSSSGFDTLLWTKKYKANAALYKCYMGHKSTNHWCKSWPLTFRIRIASCSLSSIYICAMGCTCISNDACMFVSTLE